MNGWIIDHQLCVMKEEIKCDERDILYYLTAAVLSKLPSFQYRSWFCSSPDFRSQQCTIYLTHSMQRFLQQKTKWFLQNVLSHNNVYLICLAESMWFCLSQLSDLFSTKPVCTTDTWNLSVERLYPSLPNWFKEQEVLCRGYNVRVYSPGNN